MLISRKAALTIFSTGALLLIASEPALAQNPGWGNTGTDPGEFADGVIQDIFCDLINHVEGNFGALLMSASGVFALCAAALGKLSHAQSALMVAIGAFIMSAGVSLYFGDFGCQGGEIGTVERSADPFSRGSLLAESAGENSSGISDAAISIASGGSGERVVEYGQRYKNQSDLREQLKSADANSEEISDDPYDSF